MTFSIDTGMMRLHADAYMASEDKKRKAKNLSEAVRIFKSAKGQEQEMVLMFWWTEGVRKYATDRQHLEDIREVLRVGVRDGVSMAHKHKLKFTHRGIEFLGIEGWPYRETWDFVCVWCPYTHRADYDYWSRHLLTAKKKPKVEFDLDAAAGRLIRFMNS